MRFAGRQAGLAPGSYGILPGAPLESMITLRVLQMFSGTLPGGETITLHTGNERAFARADADWLLAEYPERFEVVEQISAPVTEPVRSGETAPDPTLISKVVDVPADIEKFGAQARTGKTKKG